MILAGDIGATHARLGLFEPHSAVPVHTETMMSREFTGLEQILAAFRTRHSEPVHAACFALPGPVRAGRGTATNLGWSAEAASVARQLLLPKVRFLNDLEAVGYGLGSLQAAEILTLNQGTPDTKGNLAILCAGTGLGEAGCFWDGSQHRPFAGEGGHADFAARNDLEFALFQDLHAEFSHVSAERLLSGPGLVRMHRSLCAREQGREQASLSAELTACADPERIVRAGLDGTSQRCALCVELFASLFAAEAGNLALKLMATGGVYLGGGVALGILSLLRQPAFMQAFLDKGRMQPLLQAMPVHVILNPLVGLAGAAHCAAAL